ncbi:MAG: hypothetical protein NT133_12815 [Alphaproteobacteria bacterium]|nr:hypothetical protein [Alphaproteobacteria bacterium]
MEWGNFLIALDIGPLALLSYLIMGPMGAALLERPLLKMNPGYAAYPARTSSILPTPPKE